MGTPQFSVPILETIEKSSYKVLCVYTQPPKKSNRGQKLNSSPIQLSAENLKLTIRNPKNLNTDEELKFCLSKRSKVGTANSGVPINTILSDINIFLKLNYNSFEFFFLF